MTFSRGMAGRLLVGLFLTLTGVALLLSELGLADFGAAWRLWPLLLIGLGLAKLAWPSSPCERWNGLWMLSIGLWAGANVWQWWPLSWHNSWPVLLVVGGALMVARTLLGSGERAREVDDAH